MLILGSAWLRTARQPYLVSVTPAALGIFLPHVCVSRLFCVCAEKKEEKEVMCSACFGRFLKFPACHPRRSAQVWKDAAQHPSSGAEVAITGGEPGSWQVSGEEGRKDVKVVRGSERRTCLPPGRFWFWGWSLSILLFCFLLPPFLLSLLPWDRNPGPSKNQQHKPLRLKPLWLQNLLWITWVSCFPFHLSLYSLFLPINYKTWSRDLEDKLVVNRKSCFRPTCVKISVFTRKQKMKKQMIGSLDPLVI